MEHTLQGKELQSEAEEVPTQISADGRGTHEEL